MRNEPRTGTFIQALAGVQQITNNTESFKKVGEFMICLLIDFLFYRDALLDKCLF